MASDQLPIAGFEHLSLASQEDETLHHRTIAALSKAGFVRQGAKLVPPAGVTGQQVISAITAAFQTAKQA